VGHRPGPAGRAASSRGGDLGSDRAGPDRIVRAGRRSGRGGHDRGRGAGRAARQARSQLTGAAAMRRVHRSGVNSMVRWMGIAIIAGGVLGVGVFPVLAGVRSRGREAALMLLGRPVAVAAGAVMSVVGTRRRVAITPETVSW